MEWKGSMWPNMSSHTFVYIIKHTFLNQKANRLILLVKTRNMWIKHYRIQRRCLFNLELSLNCTKCTYVPHCGLIWVHKWDRCLQNPLCSIYPARSTVSFFSENIQWPNFWGDYTGLIYCIYSRLKKLHSSNLSFGVFLLRQKIW